MIKCVATLLHVKIDTFSIPEEFFTVLVRNYWNFNLHQLIRHEPPPLEQFSPPCYPATGAIKAGGGGWKADRNYVWLEFTDPMLKDFIIHSRYLELDWAIFKLEKCNVKLLCQVVKPSMYDDLLYPLVYMFKWFSSVLPLVLA